MNLKRINLTGLVAMYGKARLNLKPLSLAQLGYSVRSIEKFVGRKLYVDELTEALILDHLKQRMQTVSASTAKRERGDLVVLWKFAHKRGLHPSPVPDIERVKVPAKIPTAWTVDHVGLLLKVTSRLRGNMRGGIARSAWYTSLILFLYDTGCRVSAALAVVPADIDIKAGHAVLLADNSKVGIEQVMPLSEQTLEWLAKLYDPAAELVWPYPWHRRRLWLDLHEIAEAAGVPCVKGEAFHKFRRTHATLAVGLAGWDAAAVSLGHSSPQMTRRYVDPRLVKPAAIPLPRPVIGGAR